MPKTRTELTRAYFAFCVFETISINLVGFGSLFFQDEIADFIHPGRRVQATRLAFIATPIHTIALYVCVLLLFVAAHPASKVLSSPTAPAVLPLAAMHLSLNTLYIPPTIKPPPILVHTHTHTLMLLHRAATYEEEHMYQFWVNRDPRAFNSRKEYVHGESVLWVLRGAVQCAVCCVHWHWARAAAVAVSCGSSSFPVAVTGFPWQWQYRKTDT